jgi:tRNA(fMet)-specific endonuclease VapC
VNRARTPARIVLAYEKLGEILRSFGKMNVLPFDREAQARFSEYRKQKLRIGTMDLRIACIANLTGAVLLSRNLRDFRQVPGMKVEDWSR